MALILCPNCRLPVNQSATQCHLCSAELSRAGAPRAAIPVAAAVAAVATLAVLARRRARA